MTRRTSIVALAPMLALLSLSAVAIAAPTLVLAGGGCHAGADGSTYMEGDGTTVIRMDTCSFAPTVSRVAPGTTVRFLNTATVQHQVIGRSATWGSVLLDPGQEHSETFQAAGTYPYMCPLHPGMVGAIVVGNGQAPAADLAAASQPAAAPADGTAPSDATALDATAPTTDPVPLVVTGLAGLGIGLAIGALAMRSRPRTTD
jgi:plastocyanin